MFRYKTKYKIEKQAKYIKYINLNIANSTMEKQIFYFIILKMPVNRNIKVFGNRYISYIIKIQRFYFTFLIKILIFHCLLNVS